MDNTFKGQGLPERLPYIGAGRYLVTYPEISKRKPLHCDGMLLVFEFVVLACLQLEDLSQSRPPGVPGKRYQMVQRYWEKESLDVELDIREVGATRAAQQHIEDLEALFGDPQVVLDVQEHVSKMGSFYLSYKWKKLDEKPEDLEFGQFKLKVLPCDNCGYAFGARINNKECTNHQHTVLINETKLHRIYDALKQAGVDVHALIGKPE